jgi:putative DNA-invertase from lambdoid prophage Rac
MSRTFAYIRVSTAGQTTENQIREIEAAGFAVDPHRVISETISGSSALEQRPGFLRLLDRLERNDVLIVTKLDRLGRNALDVAATVRRLDAAGVRVHCLQLGGVDLTSPAGKMTMGVINAVAEFERDLIVERTQAGLTRARLAGQTLGRPPCAHRRATRRRCGEDRRRDVRLRRRAGPQDLAADDPAPHQCARRRGVDEPKGGAASR